MGEGLAIIIGAVVLAVPTILVVCALNVGLAWFTRRPARISPLEAMLRDVPAHNDNGPRALGGYGHTGELLRAGLGE